MKKMMLAASGAALVALAMPLSANALDLMVGNMASATNAVTTSKSASYAPAMDPNKSTLLDAMSHNAKAVAAIKKVNSTSEVQLLRVAVLAKANKSAFASAMSADKTAIASLRTAIKDNSGLAGQMKKQDIALNTVVGAKLDDAGNLVIYSNS